MILLKKSKKEILKRSIELLQKYTDITNITPGSRARALLEIFSDILEEFYDTLEFNVYMSFVSRATGPFLDWIGELVDCKRIPNEDDDDYRFRITQQVYVAKGANRVAIRLRALSIPGVRDVVEVPFTMGTGSFHVYVIANDPTQSSTVVANVQQALNKDQAFGIMGTASEPKNIRFKIDVTLILDQAGQNNASTIRRLVQRTIRDYINKLNMGQELVIVDLISVIKGAHKSIKNFKINSMTIKNRPVLVQDYKVFWDEKFITSLSDITVG